MSIKILITGTLDSGKTTLLNEFARDRSVTIVREVAQDIIDKHGYGITQVPEFQDMVFTEQLAREAAAEASGRPFILCDRGTIDIVAFCRIIGHPVKTEWAQSLAGRYDGAAMFSLEDIAFRPEQYQVNFDMAEYRRRVDQSIREVLAEIQQPVQEIRGTHLERLYTFREYLGQFSLREGNQSSNEGILNHRQKER